MIPESERRHYDAAVEANAKADEPRFELSEEALREASALRAEAAAVIRSAPRLLAWLSRKARLGAPAGTMGERALWRAGFEDCLASIVDAADWSTGEGDGDA